MSLNKIQRQMLDDNVVQELNNTASQLADTTKRVVSDLLNVKEVTTALGDGTDETAKVQQALDLLPISGGEVYVPIGVKFNIKNLVFPQKSILYYYGGSDTHKGAGTTITSNEIIKYIHNSAGGGAVNEQRVESSFHPGHVINVRKDVTASNLGTGQSMNNPARASYLIQDEGQGVAITQYQSYPDANGTSGLFNYLFHVEITLNGITNTSFSTVPVSGEVIKGSTSGATGTLLSIDGTKALVRWVSGVFQPGETVIDADETTTATITTTSKSVKNTNGWMFDRDTGGYMGVGLPFATHPLTVGGRIGVQRSRSFGQYLPETINDPSYVLADSFESPTVIRHIELNTTNKRVRLVEEDPSTKAKKDIAHVGAVKSYVAFTASATPVKSASSFNVSSIVQNAVGDYTINFTNPFVRADYVCNITCNTPNVIPYVYVKTVNSVRIRSVTGGTTTLVDPGVVNISCLGGDI